MIIYLKAETSIQKKRPQFNKDLLKVVLAPADTLGYESSDISFSVGQNIATRQPVLIATVELFVQQTPELFAASHRQSSCPTDLDAAAHPLFEMLVDRYHSALNGGTESDRISRELIPHTTINGFRCIGGLSEKSEAPTTKYNWGSTVVDCITLDDGIFHLEDTRAVRLSDASARAIRLTVTEREITQDINALQQRVFGFSQFGELEALCRLRESIDIAVTLLEAKHKATISTHPSAKVRRRKRL